MMAGVESLQVPLMSFYQPNRGFVLIATLSLLVFIVITVVALSSLTRIEADRLDTVASQMIARQNAFNALNMAVAHLQRSVGSDCVATSPAATLFDSDLSTVELEGVQHANWCYSSSQGGSWLGSGLVSMQPDEDLIDPVKLIAEGCVGDAAPSKFVWVGRMPLVSIQTDQSLGSYAYWIGELNTRAHASLQGLPEQTVLTDEEVLSVYLRLPKRSGVDAYLGDLKDLDDPSIVGKMKTREQLFEFTKDSRLLKTHFYKFSTSSKGLLINPLQGGFKKNLTDLSYRDALITDDIVGLIHPQFYLQNGVEAFPVHSFQITPNQSTASYLPNVRYEEGAALLTLAPILTEFKLSLGLFMNTTGFQSRGDFYHRVRFHIHSEWLNPYPYDLKSDYKKRYYLIVEGLPELDVTNEASGLGYRVDLSRFDASLRSNKPNKEKINCYLNLGLLSGSDTDFGIDAGRVYKLRSPNDTDGRARTISENEWGITNDYAPTNGSRPDVDGFPPLYLDDRLHFRSVEDVYKVNLILAHIPDSLNAGLQNWSQEPMADTVTPDEYLSTYGCVVKLKNIPFSKIDFYLPGSVYPRHTSSYRESDYRMAFHFRLKDDPLSLQVIADRLAMHDAILDFDDPLVRDSFEISSNPREAALSGVHFSQLDLFRDSKAEYNSLLRDREYQMQLFDLPLHEPVSAHVFSLLRFRNRPYPWVGSPDATIWNEVYDRYYFSGNGMTGSSNVSLKTWGLPRGSVMQNPRLLPVFPQGQMLLSIDDLKSSGGGEFVFQEGMFNIHSASIAAWTMVLKNQIQNKAQAYPFVDVSETHYLGCNLFSRLPHASVYDGRLYADSFIEQQADPLVIRYRQGIRSLDYVTDPDIWIKKLSENIVLGIRSYVHETGTLFSSISEFANAGIVQKAIDVTTVNGKSINEGIPPLAPTYLRQSDVFSLVGSILSVRSDTFLIRAYGEAVRSQRKSPPLSACIEAVVQRCPDYFDSHSNVPSDLPSELNAENNALGRRFRIVQFRWLQPYEI